MLRFLVRSGVPEQSIVVMQCTTAYPCPEENLFLDVMRLYRETFGLRVGLSDHSTSLVAGAVACALDASYIEKHITLDRKMDGPDHAASLDPTQFRQYVDAIQQTKLMCEKVSSKEPLQIEMDNRKNARRSIFARRPIASGDVFTIEDLIFLRPEMGLGAWQVDELIGRVAKKSYQTFDVIDPRETDY